MMKKIELKEGDVFSIPLGNGEIGFGQIIVFPDKSTMIICVFDIKSDNDNNIDIEIICSSPIIFLGYTTDAKLYHQDWKIVGNYNKNIEEVVLPYNKIGVPPDNIFIANYKGQNLKEINEDIFNKLSYETNIAPIRYENALKAYYKLQEWNDDLYDKLLYRHTLKSKEVFDSL